MDWRFLSLPLPPQIYAKALTHNVMAVEGGAFGKVFMFRWDHEGGAPMMELVSF